jgi:aryl-alcohol dehydrogenase-like predicted oxidoreductase
VTAALVGARDAQQTRENLKAVDIKLSKEDLAEIRNQLEALDLVAKPA